MINEGDACPVCGAGELTRKVIEETFEYKGRHLTIPDYVVYECDACEEEIVDKKTLKTSSGPIKDFYRAVDGLLTSAEIKIIRQKLALTQEEMANILGGGKKAFARYEKGQIIQSRGMDNLLRILDKYPYTLDALEVRYKEDVSGKVISMMRYKDSIAYAKSGAYTITALREEDELYG
ncbi:MAG: type II toxin-antitoxin system MqsA family antitoxin [bacterium]|nr:type II toxin-antitoxin system MqsA family antitoxin [bacterium]